MNCISPKQKDAASYCPARNAKGKNTLFSALLLFKQSVLYPKYPQSVAVLKSSCAEGHIPAPDGGRKPYPEQATTLLMPAVEMSPSMHSKHV